MNLFLSETELKELTGYVKKSHQKQILRKNNIPFVERRGGYPLVSRSIFLSADNLPKSRVEPNLGAI